MSMDFVAAARIVVTLHKGGCEIEACELASHLLHCATRIPGIILPSNVQARLEWQARRMPHGRGRGQVIDPSKNIKFWYILLNPLLETNQDIARVCNYKITEGSYSSTVATYRSIFRRQFGLPKPPKPFTSFAMPMDTTTGRYYHELAEANPAHLESPFYIFHAQQWACGLYAARMQSKTDGHNPCPYSHRGIHEFTNRATIATPLLAWDYYRRVSYSVTLPIPAQQAAQFYNNAQFKSLVKDALDEIGFQLDAATRACSRIAIPAQPLPLLDRDRLDDISDMMEGLD